MGFRTDINGLRAIAVISVIIFHFNPQFLPGGFSGVDIFFVISGYLMTGIIFKGLDNNSFSLVDFYIRRAKRIIPALALLCLVLFIFGFFFIIPKDAKELGKHAFSSLLFYSNHVYLNEIDYFDELANQKWLLHTWFLSVEWQFYMLYPIVLIIFNKVLGNKRTKLSIPLFVIIGFILNIYISKNNPNASFYLLPARFWEMLLGGFAYLYPLPERFNRNSLVKIAQLTIIALLIASFFYINDGLMWPGYYALVPTIGAYLIILFNTNTFVLDNPLMQETGKYSYSLYLWHWPIIVAFLYLQIELKYLIYILLVILFSVVGFQLSEKKRLSGLATSLYVGIGIIGAVVVWSSQGIAFRVSPEFSLDATEYHHQYYGGSGYEANTPIELGDSTKKENSIIFTGDSFGLQYASFLDNYGTEHDIKYIGLFDHGCLITPKYTRYINGKEDKECSAEYPKLQELAKKNNMPIVFAFAWTGYITTTGIKNKDTLLELSAQQYLTLVKNEMTQMFLELGDRNYYLIGIPQRAKEHAYTCLAGRQLLGYKLLKEECSTTTPKQNQNGISITLKELAHEHSNVFYIEPNDVLCKDEKCITIKDGKPIHSDYTHLSVYGAKIVGEHILQQIK